MRVIQKKISLEPITSRLPGVAPAYVPGSKYPIFFDEDSLKKRQYEYPSNYSLIPMASIIPLPDGTTIILSWDSISEWYGFFVDYNHLLKDWGSCGVEYSSAHQYYLNESKNGSVKDLRYGGNEYDYVAMDDLYVSRGGDSTYSYICKNLIPSMPIPKNYSDYWHTTRLFYPDYIKWKGWFSQRYPKYSGMTESECSGATNCCDCNEYFNRGGNEMYSGFTGTTFAIPNDTNGFVEPSILLPLSLQASLDDLGEFTIFSDEYKLGRDYRTANYGDKENTLSGTVTSVNGRAMVLSSGAGFTFDETYMEKNYDEGGWKEHRGDTIVGGETEEDEEIRYFDQINTGFYGFRNDLEKVSGETEIDVRSAITEVYPVQVVDSIFINNTLFNVEKEEWGDYAGNENERYYVYRDEYTNTPYTVIKGRKIYANVNKSGNVTFDNYFYFPFFTNPGNSPERGGECDVSNPSIGKYKTYPKKRREDEILAEFIKYGGTVYPVSESSATIDGYEYQRVIGFFSDENGTFYIFKDNQVYKYDGSNEFIVSTDYTYDAEEKTIKKNVNETLKVFEYNKITGYTPSKIYGLASDNVLIDDVGNKIPGLLPKTDDRYNHQPNQGETLDLIYQVGNTSKEISAFDGLTTDDISANVNYFYGSIITGMKFYFMDYYGNKYQETNWSESSLETINSIYPEAVEEAENNGAELVEGVFCDIEYNIGATLKRESGSTHYELAGDEFCPGVKHKETVKFVKTDMQYVLEIGVKGQIPTTQYSASANNLSYPITVYEMVQDNVDEEGIPIAEFEMLFPPQNGEWSGYTPDLQVFPVLRQEYTIGNSVMQNVEGDIYIDRGINPAFEKHIKLGEVATMEALEQYGNGYFKFQE